MPRPSIDRTLTGREVEMLHWIMAGKSDWEMARILRVSKKTVNYHVENLKKKLGSANRIAAVAVALRDGLIAFPVTAAVAAAPPSRDARPPAEGPRAGVPPAFESAFDDADHALPWAFASWQMADDSGAGPCPAVMPAHCPS